MGSDRCTCFRPPVALCVAQCGRAPTVQAFEAQWTCSAVLTRWMQVRLLPGARGQPGGRARAEGPFPTWRRGSRPRGDTSRGTAPALASSLRSSGDRAAVFYTACAQVRILPGVQVVGPGGVRGRTQHQGSTTSAHVRTTCVSRVSRAGCSPDQLAVLAVLHGGCGLFAGPGAKPP